MPIPILISEWSKIGSTARHLEQRIKFRLLSLKDIEKFQTHNRKTVNCFCDIDAGKPLKFYDFSAKNNIIRNL